MKNSEQPAFAHACTTANGSTHSIELGLTKREYFAAKAMQGFAALENKGTYENRKEWITSLAAVSIQAADELLKQLEQ